MMRFRIAFAPVLWGCGLALLLVATWLAYRPGIAGDFLFDDFGNLPAMGAYGPVDNPTTFLRYVTSGAADPVGRPLSLVSFLIDANDWPGNPVAFKRTNVLLHLLDGALLAWLLLRLGRALPLSERNARNAALVGAGAWLLHPFFVSTTLYVVQREAMLPATFSLVGLLGWIAARDALARGRVRAGLAGMVLAAWGATALAMLCKANGVLLPLLILVCEGIVLARQPMLAPESERWRKRAVRVLLVAPSVLLVVWLATLVPRVSSGAAEIRDWTLGQRVLTEPRALMEYLGLLFVPRPDSTGLFNDAFVASTSLWRPWTTAPSIAAVALLLGLAWSIRRRYPIPACAILFFFAGHVLESTVIPLELYFEHRNYLPAMLLFWPVGLVLTRPGLGSGLRRATVVGMLGLLAFATWQRAVVWGDGDRQAQAWAAQNPGSPRAQANAALYDLHHDRPVLAAARLHRALRAFPGDLQIPANLLSAECRLGGATPATLAAARDAMRSTRTGGQLEYQWVSAAIAIAKDAQCPGLDFAAIQSLVDASRANPQYRTLPGRHQDIDHLQGELDLAEGRTADALRMFDSALAQQPDPAVALRQAALLGASGHPSEGLAHLEQLGRYTIADPPLDSMPGVHAWLLRRQRYWQSEVAHLRATLQSDRASSAR